MGPSGKVDYRTYQLIFQNALFREGVGIGEGIGLLTLTLTLSTDMILKFYWLKFIKLFVVRSLG